MLVFPNCKINLGLSIIRKREDGYHDLHSIFYPLPLLDALEIIPRQQESGSIQLHLSGIPVPGSTDDNLLVKAYHLIAGNYELPAVDVYLHKNIPMGAGLGGGSSDAAFFIKALNEVAELSLSWGEMHHYAKQLGSDCSFFLINRPCVAEGRGELLEPCELSLSGYYLLLVLPAIHVPTAQAYSAIKPEVPEFMAEEVVKEPIENLKNKLKNDFEASVFAQHPVLESIKKELYENGAIYASMSGSGSAMFGLFKDAPPAGIFSGRFTSQTIQLP
jgi:4-diphosphocytidyl-2-C-methyl-D-erythritol kinase